MTSSLTVYSHRDNEMIQLHDTDCAVTSHVGLHIMLEQIRKNHGFQANVVNKVYKCLSGLEETDKILHIMREEAQKLLHFFPLFFLSLMDLSFLLPLMDTMSHGYLCDSL